MAAAALTAFARTRAGRSRAAAAVALALLAGGGTAPARAEPPVGGEAKVWRALSDEQRAAAPSPQSAAPATKARAARDARAMTLLLGALLAVVAVAVASYLAGLATRRREALSRARKEAAALLEDAGRVEGLWRRHLRARRR